MKVFEDLQYIEDPLPVSRITLGLVGGEPVPGSAVVPLPAALPVLAGALGLLAFLGWRRSV